MPDTIPQIWDLLKFRPPCRIWSLNEVCPFISVPITIRGATEQIKAAVRARPFAILLRWQRYEAVVVVDLEPM
ncbi:MAG: hypothetical protein A3I66_16450 [Burkholderiales bacterium RIFCSPLOWO2_02_FULL_57_36]|nr:MAG: hypothetical protein A3I66_16450 [Burkholderiales bacterium RIFCSPLOWO2_02_FULL_57_36]